MAYAALVLDLTAKLTGLEQGMGRAVKIAENSAAKIEKAFSFSNVAAKGGAFFAGQLGVQSVVQGLVKVKEAADEWTRIRVLVENVTANVREATAAQRGLYEAAQATRQNFGELARSYASFARNSDQLNITSEQAVSLQTTVAQAIALSGARADSAASALVQFGQGIASGALRGEELNSVLEQTPKLAKALADGLGVPIGELIRMGKEGELTADKIIAALTKVAPQIQREFDKVTPTIGDAFTALNNAIGNILNRVEELIGPAEKFAAVIIGAAQILDNIVKASKVFSQSEGEVLTNVRAGLEQRAEVLRRGTDARNFDSAIPAAVVARKVEENKVALAKIEAQIAAANAQLNAKGFNANGSLAPDFLSTDAAGVKAFEAKAAAALGKYQALRGQLDGRSNDFDNKYKELVAALNARVITQTQFFKDLEDLKKQSGLTKAVKEKKEKPDPIGDLILKLLDEERQRAERLEIELADISNKRAQDDIDAYDKKLQSIEEAIRAYRLQNDQLVLELELSKESEIVRESRLRLLDLEVAGVERYSDAWKQAYAQISAIERLKFFDKLDGQIRGATGERDQRVRADLQTVADEITASLAEAGLDDQSIRDIQDIGAARFQAVLGTLDKQIAETKDAAKELGDAFASSFEKAILGTEGFRKVLAGLGEDILKIFLRQQVTEPLAKSIGGLGKGLFGGATLFDSVLGLFGGGRADGGNVEAGKSYLVGERGPEYFMPGANGRIAPNSKLGSGVTVINNITVSGEVSRADVYNAVATGEQRTKASIADSMRRNGTFARAG